MAIYDIRCTTVTPFIKDCLTKAILIAHMNHAANVSLDTKRIIICYPSHHAGNIVLDIAKGNSLQAKSILQLKLRVSDRR
jgi:hypothetical protein